VASTILYIEDNMSNLMLVKRVLSRRPEVRLIEAMEGRLGVALAREHHPDLILLDLHLPDISGIEVLRLVREDPSTKGIPVAVISADATPGQIERLMADGVVDYLTKPLDVRKLLALLDRVLPVGGTAS
jgi:CheY-like chemotaxis protein